MSLFDLFKKNNKNNNNFRFEIDYRQDGYIESIDDKVDLLIFKWHEKQKTCIENHALFLLKQFPDIFKNDKLRIEKSCLEVSAIYIYFFSQYFLENNISQNIRKNYFIPLIHNFIHLEPELEKFGYKNLQDFINVKADYFDVILNEAKDMLPIFYYYHMFVFNPCEKRHPYTPAFGETAMSKVISISGHYYLLVNNIATEASEFINNIK